VTVIPLKLQLAIVYTAQSVLYFTTYYGPLQINYHILAVRTEVINSVSEENVNIFSDTVSNAILHITVQ